MVRVAILDYGAGNILSLKNSLERAGADVHVIKEPGMMHEYSGLLLPGVGHFDPAMRQIRRSDINWREYKDPVLGICLGMEIMFESSREGAERGLGIINGTVTDLPSTVTIPHMGWNNLEIRRDSSIINGVKDMSWVYFVHSYVVSPSSSDVIIAESEYNCMIPAIIQKDNYTGVQFHPEKSAETGHTILENFLELCKR